MSEEAIIAAAMKAGHAVLAMCEGAPLPFSYAVAGAALSTLPDWAFDKLVAAHVEERRFGPPAPPWQSLIAEAADWAASLGATELEVYATATFNALPPAQKVALIDTFMRARRAA